jgi:hypothetical protein
MTFDEFFDTHYNERGEDYTSDDLLAVWNAATKEAAKVARQVAVKYVRAGLTMESGIADEVNRRILDTIAHNEES